MSKYITEDERGENLGGENGADKKKQGKLEEYGGVEEGETIGRSRRKESG